MSLMKLTPNIKHMERDLDLIVMMGGFDDAEYGYQNMMMVAAMIILNIWIF